MREITHLGFLGKSLSPYYRYSLQVQFMLPSNKTSITCAYTNPTININNKAK